MSALRSPAFLLPTLGVITVCALMILFVDTPAALYVGEDVSKEIRKGFRKITDIGKADGYLILGALAFVGGRALFLLSVPNRLARTYYTIARAGLYFLVTMAVSGAVVHTLKLAFGRLRPKHLLKDDLSGFFMYGNPDWSNNSFPSGHSQTAFAVATVLTVLFPRAWFVFLPFAAVIAFSRVMVSAHYPSDVLLGSYIGLASALIVKRVWFADLSIGTREPAPALRVENAS